MAQSSGILFSPSNKLLAALTFFFLMVYGILVSPRTGLMILHMVAYDSMTGSLLSLSLSSSLSNLQFGFGHQLKASAAWLDLPDC